MTYTTRTCMSEQILEGAIRVSARLARLVPLRDQLRSVRQAREGAFVHEMSVNGRHGIIVHLDADLSELWASNREAVISNFSVNILRLILCRTSVARRHVAEM